MTPENKEIKTLNKILDILRKYKVKEYKTDNLHIVLDNNAFSDAKKIYNQILKDEKVDQYGPTY